MAGSHEPGFGAIRPGRRPDIVAKDLNEGRIILTLYFTIFLNQLDILFPYTPDGTGRSVPTLNDGPRLVWLRRPMMFGRVSAGWFSRLLSRPRSEGTGVVACASAAPLVVLALAVAADYAKVSHFRSRVQLAADTRQPDVANDGDVRAAQIAGAVFLSSCAAWRRGAHGRREEPRGDRDGDCWIRRRRAEQFWLRSRL